ncbi:hypothetical protein LX32DRAFT_644137 [Colletotrichum zoysiae]|uniref:Uncharacterized protein n=1 Tax=Colletotrichum zoysiae TaxID=1216348 RepID=A0AAD9H8V5_9PEZI|nr:hypothetical protein LX32DRAFT_644137 [Colletotrichum zoysiae]
MAVASGTSVRRAVQGTAASSCFSMDNGVSQPVSLSLSHSLTLSLSLSLSLLHSLTHSLTHTLSDLSFRWGQSEGLAKMFGSGVADY